MRLEPGLVVLWRGEGETQVGLAQPHVFGGLTARDQHLLAALEDGRGLDLHALTPRGRHAADALAAAGALRAGRAQVESAAPTVAVIGLGSVGVATSIALARAGYPLELVDDRPAVAEPRDVFPVRLRESSCAGAAARAVQAAIASATVRIGVSQPTIAVVTGVGSPDVAHVVPLMRSDVPHVLMASDEAGVTVGPLVIPGRTACGRCLALALTDADPAWPLLAAQCGTRRRAVVAPNVATLAGAVGSAIVDAWARGAGIAWAVNARWRITRGAPPVATPVWPHAQCGCGAFEFYSEGAEATSSSNSMPYLSSLDAPMP